MPRTIPSLARSLALGAALAVVATPLTTARADRPSPSERAADLYRRATRLYAARKLDEAEPLYREAWQLQQSYDIASNLGALELELGKHVRAAELLTHAVREFPVRGRAEERAALDLRRAQARKLVGALRFKVGAAGAEIFVDGRSVGRAPLIEQVFVEPGARVLEARLPGYVDARLQLEVATGVAYDVSLPLAPPPAPRRGAAPAIAGGILGALAAGTGVTLVALAEGQRRAANGLHGTIAGAGASCATASARCNELRGATSKADAFGNAGVGAFAIAGAAALGTATYLLWPARRPGTPRPLDLRASLGVGPGGGGAVIAGSF